MESLDTFPHQNQLNQLSELTAAVVFLRGSDKPKSLIRDALSWVKAKHTYMFVPLAGADDL